MSLVGQALVRSDGRLKVGGGARFAAEQALPRLAHAVLVTSSVARARIRSVADQEALRQPGVLLVLSHLNAPRLPSTGPGNGSPSGRVLNLLQDELVHYNNQPVALVLAETLEQAQAAARLVHLEYEALPARLDWEQASREAHAPAQAKDEPADSERGELAAGLLGAAARISALYTTPFEHHNPLEPHATVAAWDGDVLTLYDSTQYVSGVRQAVARRLGMAPEKVRVLCPYVGGGFGCKGSTWSHVVLAALAARAAGRPVKLVLERGQMFGMVGGRPYTEQRIVAACDSGGRLSALSHDVLASSAWLEDWTETAALPTRMLYACPNLRTRHRLARLDIGSPTFMRAPGEASGLFALESALDELAWELGMDPLELRLANHAGQNPQNGLPWSGKALRECYQIASQRFGWSARVPRPRAMRDGDLLRGMGMASATYPAYRSSASAAVRLLPDGSALVRSGTQELGTGTYTVLTQVAAEALGLPAARVRVEIGDTDLPRAPVSGGSQTVASVAPAVLAAATALRLKLFRLALAQPDSPLAGAALDDLACSDGWLSSRQQPALREPLAAVLARAGGQALEASISAGPGKESEKYSMHSFGAVFVEAEVDPELGRLRLPRIVACYDVGQVLNARTGHSQLMGGIVWGVGMALHEKTEYDWRYGRPLNNNLAEYHIPVQADIGRIEIDVLNRRDPQINALGARGMGEIGITGVAAAIANAVFHATGKRLRELPLRPETLMD